MENLNITDIELVTIAPKNVSYIRQAIKQAKYVLQALRAKRFLYSERTKEKLLKRKTKKGKKPRQFHGIKGYLNAYNVEISNSFQCKV